MLPGRRCRHRGRRLRHPVRVQPLQQLVQELLHQAVDRVGARVIRTVRRGRRLRTRCGFRCGLWSRGVGGKLALQLLEQLAEKLVGQLRTVGAAWRLRSVGPESEQVAQAVQPVGTKELVEQPTQRVHAVGRVVVLGLPGAVLDLVEDLAGLVDRHREADAVAAAGGARDGGVDADRPTLPVDQRAAGVAGVDGGIGLDQVVQLAHRRRDRPAERAHDAGGDRLAQAERAADGDGHLAHLHVGEGAEGEGLQIGRGALIGPDHGGVDGLVDRDHGAGDAGAVLELAG